jgi:hypothetical protein
MQTDRLRPYRRWTVRIAYMFITMSWQYDCSNARPRTCNAARYMACLRVLTCRQTVNITWTVKTCDHKCGLWHTVWAVYTCHNQYGLFTRVIMRADCGKVNGPFTRVIMRTDCGSEWTVYTFHNEDGSWHREWTVYTCHNEDRLWHSEWTVYTCHNEDGESESGWNCVPSWLCLETVIKNLHETYQCRTYSRKLLMMGREGARRM